MHTFKHKNIHWKIFQTCNFVVKNIIMDLNEVKDRIKKTVASVLKLDESEIRERVKIITQAIVLMYCEY